MDRSHRDRVAFVRVCSGRFERGMVVTHEPTGKPFATKYAHSVFGQEREHARRGVPRRHRRPGQRHRRPGGRHALRRGARRVPAAPRVRPRALRHVARARDTGRFKQFRKGVAQLDEEGVVQVLRDPDLGDQAPVFAAVGPMQLEVAMWRLENEFGAPTELLPTAYTVARRTDEASAPALRALPGVDVLSRADGTLLRAVREPLLAGPGRGRAPRPHPRPPGRRGLRGLTCSVRSRESSGGSSTVPPAAAWSAGGAVLGDLEVDEVGRRRCRRRSRRRCRRPCGRRPRRSAARRDSGSRRCGRRPRRAWPGRWWSTRRGSAACPARSPRSAARSRPATWRSARSR